MAPIEACLSRFFIRPVQGQVIDVRAKRDPGVCCGDAGGCPREHDLHKRVGKRAAGDDSFRCDHHFAEDVKRTDPPGRCTSRQPEGQVSRQGFTPWRSQRGQQQTWHAQRSVT